MKRSVTYPAILCLFVLAFLSLRISAQNAWINEMHYDNVGTDAGEFVEVVIMDVDAYDLSGFHVTLYNGTGGAVYGTFNLSSDFTPGAEVGRFTIFSKTFPSNGIQNGAPDGLSLDYQGTLIQFLSYEGTFTAVGGAATGLMSTDIMVKEEPAPAIGLCLMLQGTGYEYSQFTWAGPLAGSSPGQVNTGQTLESPLATPVSDWAVFLGVFLIGIFAFLRLRKN